MMKGIALHTIICIFSVVIQIQSSEIIYRYDYDSFGQIFPQGDGVNEFHVYKYADIDNIFDEKYTGKNIGGAYLLNGTSDTRIEFEGLYILDITATFYCGSTHTDDEANSLWIGVNNEFNGKYICEERRGWHYKHMWTPPHGSRGFTLIVKAGNATMNKAYGFDKLQIRTSNLPHQLLKRDNNISSNDP